MVSIIQVAVTIKEGFALPQKELTIFNGDPLEYWSFITSFQKSIEANATSQSKKLMYLLQYTSGTVQHRTLSDVVWLWTHP